MVNAANDNALTEPEWTGYFVVYVHNYVVESYTALIHNVASASPTADWTWGDGWALGNNTRGRYCKRSDQNKIRKFSAYLDARGAAQERKKKYPAQNFTIYYERKNTLFNVDTLESAIKLEANLVEQEAENLKSMKAQMDTLLPRYKELCDLYGHPTGSKLSMLLAKIKSSSIKETQASGDWGSLATFRRHLSKLKALENVGLEND